ncbi:hypothetical protein NBRC116188_24150 [Oceaniserpentilla sp. 4NH20-0058]|uniref:DUF2970 domain-containing protein n=1 Tax=Oceaniserpentilla sp. 4NH20-0058 TaxID=3127660 RepID=UPI0031022F2A
MSEPLNKNKVSFITALLSIMAGAFGVQKRHNMERDFNSNSPVIYIMAAIVFFILFIAAIIFVVSMVTPN